MGTRLLGGLGAELLVMARAVEAKEEERSPPLAEAEVEEARASRKEIRAHRSRRFDEVQDAAEWLDSD